MPKKKLFKETFTNMKFYSHKHLFAQESKMGELQVNFKAILNKFFKHFKNITVN